VLVRGINLPTFGPKYVQLSPYAKKQVQRYVRAQAAQQVIANNAAFSSSMFGAKITEAQGLADLAARAATQRIEKAAKAKRDELLKSLDLSV